MMSAKVTLDNEKGTATIDKHSFQHAVIDALISNQVIIYPQSSKENPIPMIIQAPFVQALEDLIDRRVQSAIADAVEDRVIKPGENYG